jgi:hypothetical protein
MTTVSADSAASVKVAAIYVLLAPASRWGRVNPAARPHDVTASVNHTHHDPAARH